MKCKDCTMPSCHYRTTDGEHECYYFKVSNTSIPQTPMSRKEQWISETAVKLIECIPYEYVTSANGQVMEARHIYAARIAKEMADVIFE